MAASTSTSALRAAPKPRIACIGTSPQAERCVLPMSRRRWRSTRWVKPARCRGSTTTTTAISIVFVAFRDAPNMLFRNDGARFTSVAGTLGVDDPRRTVGAVWFDYDGDGDLDLFTANQNGDSNGLWRNDGSRFVDVAHDLGMDAAGRPETAGSNGPSVVDVDNDGDLDLFVASYGSNFFYRNDGDGKFTEIAAQLGLAGETRRRRRAGVITDKTVIPTFTYRCTSISQSRSTIFCSIMMGHGLPTFVRRSA